MVNSAIAWAKPRACSSRICSARLLGNSIRTFASRPARHAKRHSLATRRRVEALGYPKAFHRFRQQPVEEGVLRTNKRPSWLPLPSTDLEVQQSHQGTAQLV